MAADLAQIPDVDIDSDGVFKYVLIRVHLGPPSGDPTKECKEIVRGYKWAEYHGEGGASASEGWDEGWGRGVNLAVASGRAVNANVLCLVLTRSQADLEKSGFWAEGVRDRTLCNSLSHFESIFFRSSLCLRGEGLISIGKKTTETWSFRPPISSTRVHYGANKGD